MKKFFWSFTSFGFFASLAGFLLLAFTLAHYSYGSRQSCEIEFSLTTPQPVNFAIYYDIGEGLTQKYHQQKYIEETDTQTTFSFCIASFRQLRTIRFDPAMQPVSMNIFSIILRYSDGTNFSVPLETLSATNQIEKTSFKEGIFSFTTVPDANDPSFVLSRLNNGNTPNDTSAKILHYLKWIISGFLIAILGRFFIVYFCLGK